MLLSFLPRDKGGNGVADLFQESAMMMSQRKFRRESFYLKKKKKVSFFLCPSFGNPVTRDWFVSLEWNVVTGGGGGGAVLWRGGIWIAS